MFFKKINKRLDTIEANQNSLVKAIKDLEKYYLSRQGVSFKTELDRLEPVYHMKKSPKIAVGKILKPEEFDKLNIKPRGDK